MLAKLSQSTGLPVLFLKIAYIAVPALLHAAIVFFVGFVYKAATLSVAKVQARPLCVLLTLLISASICGICGTAFWDGTHDFFCISSSFYSDTGQLKIMHEIRDIKDIYLSLSLTLAAVNVLFIFLLFRNKEAFSSFKAELKNLFGRKPVRSEGHDYG